MFLRNPGIITTLFLLAACVTGCKTSHSNKTNPDELNSLLASKLGESVTTEYNESQTFVLAYQKISLQENKARHYVVVKLADNSIVLQGSFRPGSIRWYDNNRIEVADLPGTVTLDDNPDQYKKILPVIPYDH